MSEETKTQETPKPKAKTRPKAPKGPTVPDRLAKVERDLRKLKRQMGDTSD